MVAASFLANIAYSEQFSASYGVFIYHIGATTGWGRTVLAGAKTVGRITEALLAPFVGPLVDRYGARWLMVGGGIVFGIGFMLVATVDQLWQLYLYFGVLAPIGGVCLGGFVTTVAIANWFVSKRGRAIAIANMGMTFGTTLLPLLASAMIEGWGWRGAWFAMGVMILILTIPAGFLVRRRPEDLGLHPDGVAPGLTQLSNQSEAERRRREALLAADVRWSRRQVLRSPLMWIIVFSWGIAQFAMASTTLHMVPFFQDLGYSLLLAAGAVSLRSGIALVGNPVWGYVVERVPIKPVASLHFTLTGLGVAMWLLPPSDTTLLAGIVLFGLGASGSQIVSEIIWANFYGRVSLGTVRGIAYPVQTMFAALGPLIVGLLYDLSGSYQSSFAIMLAGCALSAALIQLARPPIRPSRLPMPELQTALSPQARGPEA